MYLFLCLLSFSESGVACHLCPMPLSFLRIQACDRLAHVPVVFAHFVPVAPGSL